MATRNTVRKELREAIEIKVALLSIYSDTLHMEAIRKIDQLLKNREYLNIATLQRALSVLRQNFKDNFKNGRFKNWNAQIQ